MSKPIRRLLVANRGEIARRVFRTAAMMGIETVAVYSEPDRNCAHVADADVAVALGGATSTESYLDADKILDAARRTGADAIHPGYGFLSENPGFAERVVAAGLTWVGPSPANIRAMAGKIEAKRIAAAAGLPLVPGCELPDDRSEAEITSAGSSVGYPLLVKASAGGGGKGMRLVSTPGELPEAVVGARREARASFGDGTVFLERYLSPSHHVEAQVFGDLHGNVVHLFERECSIQRRHQKIIEESPSPTATADTVARLCAAAVELAKSIKYVGAGTVEFLVSGSGADQEFYFLEMNTRLQVEHPVTEETMTRHVDLVEWQLGVAMGEALPLTQSEIGRDGHAIEVRLYAEDPARDYLPASGRLVAFNDVRGGSALRRNAAYSGIGSTMVIRDEISYRAGDEVTPLYDPMVAKIISWGADRREAAGNLAADLAARDIVGITTNRDSLVAILRSEPFLAGNTPTDFLAEHPELLTPDADGGTVRAHLAAATLVLAERRRESADWRDLAWPGWRNVPAVPLRTDWLGAPAGQSAGQSAGESDGMAVLVNYSAVHEGQVSVQPAGESIGWTGPLPDPAAFRYTPHSDTGPGPGAHRIDLELDGIQRHYRVAFVEDWVWVNDGSVSTNWRQVSVFGDGHEATEAGGLTAPVPGTVVAVDVAEGDQVSAGQTLLVLEAMKMEHRITAPVDGLVGSVLVRPGQSVDAHQLLATVTEEGTTP